MEYIELLSEDKKIAFMIALAHIGHSDNNFDEDEKAFIKATASMIGIGNDKLGAVVKAYSDKEVVEIVKTINDRRAALELIREMCTIAHEDGDLSDEETISIAKIGLAMGVDLDKIEEISKWVIEGLIWRDEGQLIFEKAV